MQLRMFQVDVFADRTFGGNPAAVVLLDGDWLPDEVLQAVAAENYLAETAFVAPAGAAPVAAATVEAGPRYGLRWFTPTTEVELCGHATLAAGYVVLRYLDCDASSVSFSTRWAGDLRVDRERARHLTAALPLDPPRGPSALEVAAAVAAALGAQPVEVVDAAATIARFSTAAEVAALDPDFRALGALATPWVVATAPGTGEHQDHDWVCRYFAPGSGIDEDHVTGSAQTYLAPYWWPELDVPDGHRASARQLSPRGGTLLVRRSETPAGPVVLVTGEVADYLEGTITFPMPDDAVEPPVARDRKFGGDPR